MIVANSPFLNMLGSARIIAIGRIALAISLLVLSVTDPDNIGFREDPDDLIALGYLLISIVVATVAWRLWWLDHVWQPFVLAIDVAIFIALPSLVQPEHDGYRIAALTDATFIMLSVALRWDWRLAGITALVLNLLNWLLTTFRPIGFLLGSGQVPIQTESADYIRNLYFFLLISLLIVWVGSRIPGMPVVSFKPSLDSSRNSLLDDALHFIMRATRAKSGMICWQARGDGQCLIRTAGMAASEEQLRCRVGAPDDRARPCLFDMDRHLALCLTQSDEVEALRRHWDPPRDLLENPVRKGAYLPIAGASGSGMLILGNCAVPGVDLLRYLNEFAREIATDFDRFRAREIDRDEERLSLRNELARNLHDSVAQTIAGMRYWLSSMREAKPSDVAFAQEVDRLDEVLADEAYRLRDTIDELRGTPGERGNAAFAQSLIELTDALAKQWQVPITLDLAQCIAAVPRALDFEIQQMIREGVSNAVRHAGADEIQIRLSTQVNLLEMVIADDGRGFPAGGGSVKPLMLSQRADDLGGMCSVESSDDGSTVKIELPLGAKP